MGKYFVKRVLQMIPSLLIISFAVFMIINLIDGNPAITLAGANASEAQLQALTEKFGLDQPLLNRYFIWLGNIFRGDMGNTLLSQQPVALMIGSRLGATVELTLVATVLSLIISVPAGVVSALKPNGPFDRMCTGISAFFFAVPGFWLAIMLMLIFSLTLKLLPPSGRANFLIDPVGHIKTLILPATTIAIGMAAKSVRFIRASLIEVFNEDYITTAKARGVKHRVVIYRHAIRNALIPVITIVGLQMGDLLGGSLIIEQIFGWPGIGSLAIQAINWRDYNLLQGTVLYIVLMFMVINFIVDILHAMVDSRVRLE